MQSARPQLDRFVFEHGYDNEQCILMAQIVSDNGFHWHSIYNIYKRSGWISTPLK
ncbi:protein of unknown function [Vibrio tapetis subsp. tapetis]|uniref:Uncharacterized protein n=1 Tax=Vibrio tapetis subsp. tapetis TaxID=1671868 RepID=A0A2N8ZCY8_9VIBR|nr:protein of unknown function [Vibrio tapetis subsp. tapetis]